MIKPIKNILFLSFFLISFAAEKASWKENLVYEKNTSFGLMSEKLGTDFWNFSRTIYRKNVDEIFISLGPSIYIPSNAGFGWKHYFKSRGKKGKIVPFSCMSLFSRSANKMSNNSGDSIRTDDCVGISGGVSYFLTNYKKRDVYINIGLFASYDFRNKPFGLPVINVEFKSKD